MPFGTVIRDLKDGYGPSRESLFDSLRLGYGPVHVKLLPMDSQPEKFADNCERFAHEQEHFRCRVKSIARIDSDSDFDLILEDDDAPGRVVLSFCYDPHLRRANPWVRVEWTTETCDNGNGGGCGETLWPGRAGVCQHYPACCEI